MWSSSGTGLTLGWKLNKPVGPTPSHWDTSCENRSMLKSINAYSKHIAEFNYIAFSFFFFHSIDYLLVVRLSPLVPQTWLSINREEKITRFQTTIFLRGFRTTQKRDCVQTPTGRRKILSYCRGRHFSLNVILNLSSNGFTNLSIRQGWTKCHNPDVTLNLGRDVSHTRTDHFHDGLKHKRRKTVKHAKTCLFRCSVFRLCVKTKGKSISVIK